MLSVINDHLIGEVLLPGLYCLHKDVQAVAQDHVMVLESMIREFEEKIDSSKLRDRLVTKLGAMSRLNVTYRLIYPEPFCHSYDRVHNRLHVHVLIICTFITALVLPGF